MARGKTARAWMEACHHVVVSLVDDPPAWQGVRIRLPQRNHGFEGLGEGVLQREPRAMRVVTDAGVKALAQADVVRSRAREQLHVADEPCSRHGCNRRAWLSNPLLTNPTAVLSPKHMHKETCKLCAKRMHQARAPRYCFLSARSAWATHKRDDAHERDRCSSLQTAVT